MSKVLSDYNSSTITASVVAKTGLYSDLDLTFLIHPTLKDIRPITDIDAVKASVKNLVLAGMYERPFHPELGGGVNTLLFEPVNAFTIISLRDAILRALNDEPRIKNIGVEIIDDSFQNAYAINIEFTVLYDQKIEVQFYLDRLR